MQLSERAERDDGGDNCGEQLEPDRAGVSGAIAGSAEWEYFWRAAGLCDDPAGFSAATARGRASASSPPSRRRWRAAREPGFADTEFAFDGVADGEPFERADGIRGAGARSGAVYSG